jgi:hypothetical protein
MQIMVRAILVPRGVFVQQQEATPATESTKIAPPYVRIY